MFSRTLLGLALLLCLATRAAVAAETAPAPVPFTFTHPGLLHSAADFARMKAAVDKLEPPVYAGFTAFSIHPQSKSDYTLRGPFDEIGRNPNLHFTEYDTDANAAYQCALMWAITGSKPHAARAIEILNAWSKSLKRVSGADAVLMAGLGPFKMINAAEMLRYTNAGWADADAKQFETMLKTAIVPTLRDFAPFANGNWDTAAVKTLLAIAVHTNDRDLYERALRYYTNGQGDGAITHYIISEAGQCQESGRDMPHTQLGLAHLGDTCQIAWNQGLNLYAYRDNLLLKAFEYTSNYNLGASVPFIETTDRTGKYHHTAIAARGEFRPVFEQIFNHYGNLQRFDTPFTEAAAAKVRPEGAAQGADHTGFGTLLFTIPQQPRRLPDFVPPAAPRAPAALYAQATGTRINLSWVAPVDAASYVLRRASAKAGPYAEVAADFLANSYADAAIRPGEIYYYTVSARNAAGESAGSPPVAIAAGLPPPWQFRDVGEVLAQGHTQFDGGTFKLEGSGLSIGGLADQFQTACIVAAGNGTITARFVPQFSSQSTRLGLMARDGFTTDALQVALLLVPRPGANAEAPTFAAQLLSRTTVHTESAVKSMTLSAPQISYGRFVEPYWLRLERASNTFTGSVSADGKTWIKLGDVTVPMNHGITLGLVACSGIPKVSTTVMFDNVTAK